MDDLIYDQGNQMQHISDMWTAYHTEKQRLHYTAFTTAVKNNQHGKH